MLPTSMTLLLDNTDYDNKHPDTDTVACLVDIWTVSHVTQLLLCTWAQSLTWRVAKRCLPTSKPSLPHQTSPDVLSRFSSSVLWTTYCVTAQLLGFFSLFSVLLRLEMFLSSRTSHLQFITSPIFAYGTVFSLKPSLIQRWTSSSLPVEPHISSVLNLWLLNCFLFMLISGKDLTLYTPWQSRPNLSQCYFFISSS